jgi:hypothetical protein
MDLWMRYTIQFAKLVFNLNNHSHKQKPNESAIHLHFISSYSDFIPNRRSRLGLKAGKGQGIQADQPFQIYNIKGSMTSEIKVDRASGWIIEAKISQKMKGDSHVKGNPQMPNGMTIPMETATETVVTN